MNPRQNRQLFRVTITFFIMGLTLIVGSVAAQDDVPRSVERIVITSSDVSSLPSIELRLFGRDAQGAPLDFSQETVSIQHDGAPAGLTSYQGEHQVGTFTLFLMDIPPGVAEQLPQIQDAITQFATPETMVEQVDSLAVYQVGGSGAAELLEPTSFYNSVINLFTTPLTPETGPTALIDSTVRLLEQMESLKLNPEMASSIVLLTDGTDSVSTQFDGADVAETAVRLGIPVHTVWLNNENLGPASHEAGQEFLATVAAQSGGVAVQMGSGADMPLIWSRIGGFRNQARVRYTVSGLTAGEFTIRVSLVNDATVNAETAVSIPNNIPSIQINLPAESRTMTLPDLEDPVTLRFNTTLGWLDEQERTIEAAQLVVNGETSADIPIDQIDQFDVAIDSLIYGNNSVEVVILDEQGLRARSPELILTVNEGSQNIPSELNAGVNVGQLLGRVLLIAAMLIIAAIVWVVAWRGGLLQDLASRLPRGRSRRREPQISITNDPAMPSQQQGAPSQQVASAPSTAYFEVLETTSDVPVHIPLHGTTVRLGRSPGQADVVFEQDVTMSRRHATLMLEGSHYRLFDEQSTSGTWVNDSKVPEYGIQLNDGDEIFLGAVHLRFRKS
ncbi:MAG: FHA domain-containing protein [Chloroflexi bacterium]|nr:FHA domain-containing protein [Chloroflexota bacterium]